MVRVKPAFQKRRIEKIKEHLSVVEVANDLLSWGGYGAVRRSGSRFRGVCPLCHNGEHSKAFSSDGQLFYCFACQEGGDVVTLAALANDMPPAMAAAWLAQRYGIKLPDRPDSWYAKQDRQARLRERIEAERKEIKRRRLFKYLVLPELEHIEPEADRRRETIRAWDRFQRLPLP